MKKYSLIITLLSILLNIALVYIFVIKGNTTTTADERITIHMNENHKDFVMKEMREFLESVQQINEGILQNQPELIIKAAEKSGGSVIAHAPQGLLKSLPASFKALGFATHDIFDEIGETAKNNYDPQKTQTQLHQLLQNCVACHQAFKITVDTANP